ncbi:hypothetical protein CEXT_70411 [Caerostris extrusa]|uniref:Uncharacterized protein n=1 Tax=Caerostris extrusa TaxID=172846 RepID=A0AAV4XIA1_CAEEX|nr:hypothetical protein CEXT_70411 [Caerostris extrusa]
MVPFHFQEDDKFNVKLLKKEAKRSSYGQIVCELITLWTQQSKRENFRQKHGSTRPNMVHGAISSSDIGLSFLVTYPLPLWRL